MRRDTNDANGGDDKAIQANCWPVWSPLLAVVLISLLIRIFDIDRTIATFSYNAAHNEWPFYRAEPLLSFYRYGIYLPMIVGVTSAIIAALGPWIIPKTDPRRLSTLRRSGLFLALMLVIGPGLLIESGLKSFWGRPRPYQCTDFGGEMKFLPIGEWGATSFTNSSFPSGHAGAAFFLMGLGFVVNPNRPKRRLVYFWAGTGYGIAMSFTRVLQGGHFLSDVLWSAIIVYLVGVFLARLILWPATVVPT